MVQSREESPFIRDLAAVADTIGPISDSTAQTFLAQYPLDLIFMELSRPSITSVDISTARTALEKIFASAYGSALLPQLLPYAAAVLQSAAAPTLRQLAVHQLARLLSLSSSSAPGPQLQQQQEVVGLLLGAMQDEDVGVAAEAEKALGALGSWPPALGMLLHGTPAARQLADLAASRDAVVATRALTLVLRLAAASPAAAAAVRGTSLLAPLLRALGDPADLLGAAAALQLVREAAEVCDAGMATALGEAAMPALAALMQGGPVVDPVLQCGSLQAGAALLSASLEAGRAPMAVDETPTVSSHPTLVAIKSILDASSLEQFPQELEEAALDAVATIGLKAAGATAILQDSSRVIFDVAYMALGRAPNPAIRICALHALAAVAGAERAASAGRVAAALLGPEEEDTLRAAVYDGALASSPTATPADVALEYLDQPFPELHVATYRALSALLARDWMAAAVCSHTGLLDWLLNPQSESGRQGCKWRYACVRALAGTVRAATGAGGSGGGANGVAQQHSQYQAVLAAAAQRVDDAVAQGPYGASRAAPEQYQVATIHRGGGGV